MNEALTSLLLQTGVAVGAIVFVIWLIEVVVFFVSLYIVVRFIKWSWYHDKPKTNNSTYVPTPRSWTTDRTPSSSTRIIGE